MKSLHLKKSRTSRQEHHRPAGIQTSNRHGLTLSEVLVSTLIMSIGLVSLATLFPISMIRTIQATQLTNSALLRQNVEALIESDSRWVHDPDRRFNTATITGVVGVTTPTFDREKEHRPDVDLNGDGDTLDSGEGWGADWLNDGIRDSGAYLVDPMAFLNIDGSGTTQASVATRLGLLPRFSGLGTGALPPQVIDRIGMLPDSWQPVFQSQVLGQNNTTFRVTIPGGTDFTNLTTSQLQNTSNPDNAAYRMVLFDGTKRRAVIKELRQIVDNAGSANDELIWQDGSLSTLPLPDGFTVASVKVESQERRYSWLMTVRKDIAGTASVDVVTFFDRSFRPQDELDYGTNGAATGSTVVFSVLANGSVSNGFDGQPGFAGVDDDGDGTTDNAIERGTFGSDDRRTITLGFTGAAPFLKQGGYILDTVTGLWYRIVEYSGDVSPVQIVVDRDLVPNTITPRLVFPRGVLEVYPLGARRP